MRKSASMILLVLFVLGGTVSGQPNSPQQPLPQIQLKEYTIVGLEKVVLPRKERQPIFRKVPVQWVPNAAIAQHRPADIDFHFYRREKRHNPAEKPLAVQLSGGYGVFNTVYINANTRLPSERVTPYLNVDYQTSDGHVANAQYSLSRLNTGVQANLGERSFFRASGNYRQNKQGVYGRFVPSGVHRQVVATGAAGDVLFQQQLSSKLQAELSGQYRFSEQKYGFRDQQYLYAAGAALRGVFPADNVQITLQYQNVRNVQDSALFSNDLKAFGTIRNQMWTSELLWQHRLSRFWFSLGGTAQNLTEEADDFPAKDSWKLSPALGFSFHPGAGVTVSASYNPHYELPPLETLQGFFLPANLSGFAASYNRQWIKGQVAVRPGEGFSLNMFSLYRIAEQFPLIVSSLSPAAPLRAGLDSTAIPYWEYAFAEEAMLWENTLNINWKARSNLLMQGWFTVRETEIRKVDQTNGENPAFLNKRLPYLPALQGRIQLNWKLTSWWKWMIRGEFTDVRYNDLDNTQKLDSYFLLNTEMQFSLSPALRLRLFGKNLTNVRYEWIYSMSAAPTVGGAILEVRF